MMWKNHCLTRQIRNPCLHMFTMLTNLCFVNLGLLVLIQKHWKFLTFTSSIWRLDTLNFAIETFTSRINITQQGQKAIPLQKMRGKETKMVEHIHVSILNKATSVSTIAFDYKFPNLNEVILWTITLSSSYIERWKM